MNPTYKVLLEEADHGTTSSSVQFTQGVATFIIYGDMPHGHEAVIIEISHDNVNFAPISAAPTIDEPVSFSADIAHGCWVRARVPEHGGSGCSVTVVIC